MRLLVTGGSSFVGAHFCRRAASQHDVLALHHQTPLALNGVTPVRCDLRHPAAVDRLKKLNADMVVHLACKAIGKPDLLTRVNRRLMDVVLALELPVVYASSTVVHWSQDTTYGRCRKDDEARLGAGVLPYAIVRPAAPYGPRLREHRTGHTESFHTLADFVRSSPFVPIMGNGQVQRQPLHVHDFVDAMLALIDQGLPSAAFDAGGSQVLSMDQVIDTLASAMGTRPRKLHLPTGLFQKLAGFAKDLDPEMLAAFGTDDVVDHEPLERATGVRMRPFLEGARDLR
jgi:nucleoside-diphosphate-sugar epimerase